MPDIIETTDASAGTTTAYSLQIGQIAQGRLSAAGDHDWYRVTLTAGQIYTVALVGTGTSGVTDPYLQIYGTNGSTVVASDDDSLPNINSVVTFTASTSGTYYIDAGAYNNSGAGQYGVSITTGTRAIVDVPMGAGIIDAYGGSSEYAWSATPGTGATVTVGFRVTDDGLEPNFSQFSAQQRTALEAVLQLYRDVCGLNLVNSGQTDNATILLSNYNYNDNSGGYAQYPGSTAASSQAGNIHINIAGGNSTTSVPVGSYSFFTLMHEFGHAVGLTHPGLYNAAPGVSITYAANAEFTQDTHQYTVMSYFDESYTTGSYGSYPDGLMLYDIYALQQIYGANMSTRTGATVYGFNSTAGGIYDFTSNTSPALCIWDAGGIDTLDLSGYASTQSISLVAGTFCSVGGLTGNLSIAYGCTIENAVGGSGNDTITGNSANNILRGGGGTDTIDGGAGWDKAMFTGTIGTASISRNTTTNTWTITSGGQTATLTNVEVAQFSNGTRALRERPAADFNADNRSDILWRNTSSGSIGYWQMSGGSPQLVGLSTVASSWTISGSGDFNADGGSEILWRNSNGLVGYWNVAGSQPQFVGLSTVGNDWSIAGTGDFDVDGRTDVLWRNSNGGTGYWTLSGSQPQLVGLASVGNEWDVSGIGDFNADGRSDILWRNDNGQVGYWNVSSANPTFVGLASVGNDWEIAGTGDFNADGRTDVLWQNDSGWVGYWSMATGQVQFNGLAGVGNDWSIAGTGDYNTDGRTDVLWRNAGGGVSYWNLAAGQPQLVNLATVDSSWQIQPT
ncbi:M10 family metallopeptidase C-terminal domain-containing protein [Rhodoplanes sp. TEM]|uniref:M10 family metallopeptidase C-terminal domain-containing protein n=1 Tax=Rhodoplanes tepidamans TaxID=200616 RepID=A0ABT5J3X9_RHOTP|nr:MULTISPECIES: M10 family metallopeptidase C-terminal domain-containing protein [Rhodoplanes]MDC7784345.1 M10 family metallopeptidase C-terminal domain-containing protein [Rhodoplanes tepidamans]MDC7983391.1 M10 family metallopeptidase C-terminal domain-containing protein [Rhodoplanes sp. TEM]MDQ0354527.1 hypothetical protein [Rhodoplanes tepidamans]